MRGGRGDREARLKFYRHLVGPVLDVNVMIPVCFFLHLQERGIMRTELFFCKYRAAFNLHSRRSIRSKSGDENINPCLRARLEANERSGSHFKHRSHPLKDGTCLDFLLSRHQQLCGLVVAPAR